MRKILISLAAAGVMLSAPPRIHSARFDCWEILFHGSFAVTFSTVSDPEQSYSNAESGNIVHVVIR
jgi:hypothetical protein